MAAGKLYNPQSKTNEIYDHSQQMLGLGKQKIYAPDKVNDNQIKSQDQILKFETKKENISDQTFYRGDTNKNKAPNKRQDNHEWYDSEWFLQCEMYALKFQPSLCKGHNSTARLKM